MGKSQSKLSPEQYQELQSVTQFSKKEIQQWYNGFIQDAPQGFLTKTDFYMMYTQFFPFGDPIPFADHLFRLFDLNHNGQIEFREYLQVLCITSRGRMEDKLDLAFRLYDVDRDGMISKDDMYQILEAIYRMVGNIVSLSPDEDTPAKRVEGIFSRMDKDQDNKLSLEEFKEGAASDSSIIQAITLYDGLV